MYILNLYFFIDWKTQANSKHNYNFANFANTCINSFVCFGCWEQGIILAL